jgi:hypothetical protein
MNRPWWQVRSFGRSNVVVAACVGFASLAASGSAAAQGNSDFFKPGNLVVSRSVFTPNPAFGPYPFVWNNDLVDASFGLTSRILLDQMTTAGHLVNTLEVPNNGQNGVPPTKDQMVTSFSSKSELALNLSTDGEQLTFMGYLAGINDVDVSNSNTPLAPDPTNPATGIAYRLVGQVDAKGKFRFTKTNAYSGNNGRAAILHNTDGSNVYFTAGNAGNGGNPQPVEIVLGAGTQFIPAEVKALAAQTPDLPTPLGSFSVTQLGAKPDKVGKDDNFRGLTIFEDVVYLTKGSGGNGVNTVYFIDTSQNGVCPKGVGLPMPGASLPVAPLAYDPTTVAASGLPSNMCILNGFPTTLNSALKATTTAYPFGVWFANDTTLYVADEGDGKAADVNVASISGLQKWVLDKKAGKWNLAYTLKAGLGLGTSYSFPGDAAYPTGINPATGVNWAPLTAGLRNITGRVNGDGTVTIWAVTATVSGNGDQGADPNLLVKITDDLTKTGPNPPTGESFVTVRAAAFGEVLRGVSFTPGTFAP